MRKNICISYRLVVSLPLIFLLCGHEVMAMGAPLGKVLVPAGSFRVGCSVGDGLCGVDEGPKGGVLVSVPAFYIDISEVSVAEYRNCVEASACKIPFTYKRTHYCNYDAPGRDEYPVNCVNWQQASNYCRWQGGRLAFEVEWEKAARAGTSNAHPWGSQPASCERAVMDPGKPGEKDTETDGCWRDLTWPRNSFPANQLGLYDMVGGLSEWVMDWYTVDLHLNFYQKGRLLGPEKGELKVIKGGAWDEKFWAQRVSNRFAKPVKGNPDLYGSNGIRCVTPLPSSLGRSLGTRYE